LLKSLGDSWCVYNSPGEGGLVLTGLTAVVSVRDADRLAKVQQRLCRSPHAGVTVLWTSGSSISNLPERTSTSWTPRTAFPLRPGVVFEQKE